MQAALIDYGASNLRSVEKALEAAGARVTQVRAGAELGRPDVIVVPGQGHFGQAMDQIRRRGFEEVLRKKVLVEKIPYLGICIGCQILMEESEEAPGVRGLGWLRGRVVRFRGDLIVPHMGWNEVQPIRPNAALKAQGGQGVPPFFYFVHSYYPAPADSSAVVATCEYGGAFACAVQSENIFAVQFHPEKSQAAGRAMLTSFLQSV
ncbi:MAG: imidazole glycerol phosphate synthase, glutamine amidotransferase subunit [Candidatus Lindowbacteria bacterium RIFCSPLOWO2_12_FULL_62_27]|nr:MAG: imidazole glycerol phosphate synthase, glutamine amidotransferase subunit [Candidatus Lindowbacteria bacterium RIFCSPLOWO2_12_FULL_62_27]